MEEIWKNIEGYPNYMVSNLGNVKSLIYRNNGKEKILKPSTDRGGYYRICLRKNGKTKHFQIHRLVYEAFVGEIPEGLQCNHINEVKTDNRLENLNLMTPKENINWGTGIQRRIKKLKGKKHTEEAKKKMSESHKGKVVSEESKKKIRQSLINGKNSKTVLQYDLQENFIKEWPSMSEIKRQLGFATTHISRCCNGGYFHNDRNKWVNVSQTYGYVWRYKEKVFG